MKLNGTAWDKAWSFTTQSNELKDHATMNNAIVKLVNSYRLRAGLRPVTFDKDLSRGCYSHAQYLLTNWGHPEVKGLGMPQRSGGASRLLT